MESLIKYGRKERRTMEKLKHDLALRVVKLLNLILMTIPFACCWYGYYLHYSLVQYYRRGNWLIIFIFFVLYFTFGRIYDGFLISLNQISEIFFSQVLAALFSNGIMFIIIWLLLLYFPNPIPILLAFATQLLISIVWATLAHKWYFHTFKAHQSAVVYDVRKGLEQLIGEYGLEKKFEIIKTAKVEECLEDLSMLDELDSVFLSGIHSHDRNIILKYCIKNGVNVYVIPRVGDVLMSGAKKMHMFHLPMLRVGRYSPTPEFLFTKRMFDIVVSLTALILCSPVLLVTALAIKLNDGGPVFYKQCRLTKDGKEFDILKFRSMKVDAEKDGVARLSTGENDDRITPVGHVIRKYRIDELPQLINILKGELSVVGPRPERPSIATLYEEEMPEFNLRLQAKAGLTGYAQVYGKYNTTPYDKLQMDLMYIANPSFLEDIKICFATVKILFTPESTEGIAEGETTALGGKEEA